ncbi:MAG: hypothetical protein M0Z25_05295 [Nitrospiraceae bacterium]|nr:hypothetical protein [Nitrospiraceae bacterium]
MTISLTGYEALAEAYYADHNVEVLVNSKFFVDQEGTRIPVDPFQALEMFERWNLNPGKLSCEVLSVWEYLQSCGGGEDFLQFFLCPRTALVLTKDHGDPLTKGIRGFAVEKTVYDKALSWAKSVPITEPDHDYEAFLGRLEPRLPLKKGMGHQKDDLARYAREIAQALMELFGLDRESVKESLMARHVVGYERTDVSLGGDLLDIVLEGIGKTHGASGSFGFFGREGPAPSVA